MTLSKNYYFKVSINLTLGIFIACLIVFFLQYYLYDFTLEPTLRFLDKNTKLFFLQSFSVFVLYSWLYFILDSGILSGVLIFALACLIGEATSQKLLLRGEPLYPSDIYFLKDISFLIDMVDIKTLLSIIAGVVFIFIICIMYFIKRKKYKRTTFQKVLRLGGAVVSSLLLLNIYNFNQPGNKIKALFNDYTNWISYSQDQNYRVNGVVSGILYNLKSPALNKPDTYSKKEIERIYSKYLKEAERINEQSVCGKINLHTIAAQKYITPQAA